MRILISSPKQRAILVIILVVLSLIPISYFVSRNQARNEISAFLSSADLEMTTFNITQETPEGIYISGLLLVNSSDTSKGDSFFRIKPMSLDVSFWEDSESLGSIHLLLSDETNISKRENAIAFPFLTFFSLEDTKNDQNTANKFLEELLVRSPLTLEISGILTYEFLGSKDSATFSNSLSITGLEDYRLLKIVSINPETSDRNEIEVATQLHNPFQISFSINGSFQVFVNRTNIGSLDLDSPLLLEPGVNTFTFPLSLSMPIIDLIQLLVSLSNFTILLEGNVSVFLKYHQFLLDYSLDLSPSNGSILGARIIDISNVSIDLETSSIALLLSANITNASPLILTIARANISIYTSDWEFLANGTWNPKTPTVIDAYEFLLIYDLPIIATNVTVGNLLQVIIEQLINLKLCITLSISSNYIDVCLRVSNVEL